MKRPIASVFLVAFGWLAAGCALTTSLVPVDGPMSQVRPLPIIQARAERMGDRKITFTLPDGNHCAGRWASAGAGEEVSFSSGSLLSEYGSVHLSGYSVSASGQTPGQALIVCQNGNVFQIEFVSGSGGGFGIAKDNAENIYRFVF